ncbi:hypothetical protein L6164_017945 [Bauhinia variegata]|uniref:Uncharacterized protein n=1 Tax=Bauhinia variegata TaxID=167791 RepID=A0ACB9N9Q4_BAUVA|nr:hypothetical protein L6164_017945 [Bauhinia variegata]
MCTVEQFVRGVGTQSAAPGVVTGTSHMIHKKPHVWLLYWRPGYSEGKSSKGPVDAVKMKMGSQTIEGSKRRVLGKGMVGLLKEGRGRFYILRRCIIMLLCSHD